MKTPFILGSVAARRMARKTSRRETGVSFCSSFNPESRGDALNSGGASEIGTARSKTKREFSATFGPFAETPTNAMTAINPSKASPISKKMAKRAPKKDPKNDFIYFKYGGDY